MTYFYSYFSGHGRRVLCFALDSVDPFGLAPGIILARVLDAGYTPSVAHPSHTPWPTIGRITEVMNEDQTFLVAVSRDAEEISIQEVRKEPYNPVSPQSKH